MSQEPMTDTEREQRVAEIRSGVVYGNITSLRIIFLLAEIDRLQQERDQWKERTDSFLRDGARENEALARQIVETLRPTDEPGSSEYNVVWVGSKLKSIKEAAEAELAKEREKVRIIVLGGDDRK